MENGIQTIEDCYRRNKLLAPLYIRGEYTIYGVPNETIYEYFFKNISKGAVCCEVCFAQKLFGDRFEIFFLVVAKLFICRKPHYLYLVITMYNLAVAI